MVNYNIKTIIAMYFEDKITKINCLANVFYKEFANCTGISFVGSTQLKA